MDSHFHRFDIGFLSLFAQRYLFHSNLPRSSAVRCRPPLPNQFSTTPIRRNSSHVNAAIDAIDAFVHESFFVGGTNALVMAIVTPEGVIICVSQFCFLGRRFK
ncbi:hypothetical protein B0H10DRAFT_650307 [Mycena sp. CBHHK59/15]|nr:hypothetical protein B0H10DRAFT_650307 [Mycena sp. CBHHK59/15]